MEKYADVIVSINHKSVDRIFTYQIPSLLEEKIQVGMRVWVPFGNSNKKIEGYVLGISETKPALENVVLKSILALPDDQPMFSKEMLALAQWMRHKYYTTLAQCLKCIMPAGIQTKTQYVYTVAEPNSAVEKPDPIVQYIQQNNNQIVLEELEQEFGNVYNKLRTLEKKGIVTKTQATQVKDYVVRVKMVSINEAWEDIEAQVEEEIGKGGKGGKVLEMVKEHQSIALLELKEFLKITEAPILTLEKKGLLQIEKIEIRRNILPLESIANSTPPQLLPAQQNAVEAIRAQYTASQKKPILLHGVTGSGKTEVYLKIIDDMLKLGKQAIVLVPEIALTPQTVSRFISRYGERVTVTHSRLSLGERYDQWKKARDGTVDIMIGPRSALFTPFARLGVIIIDEEHENTYISETAPKYHTKEVAHFLAEQTDSLLVLGSATPSVDSYFHALEGDYQLVTMKERVNQTMPQIEVVDMRQELALGNRSIFSNALQAAMVATLEKGEQCILFLNRRGHSTFVSCRSCGHVLKCEHCNVNFTYHLHSKKVVCHYCGKQTKAPENCPVCGSKYIRYFGVGTQKVEAEIQKMFPDETILRMDLDTVAKKNSHERILNQFRRGESRILIGTQMIAKGLDFPNVTLVGIIAADISLNAGDYRSGESTFQLLTQVAGRAGRADLPGQVVIQTYSPEHYSIVFAQENNYEQFYEHEILLRKQMIYPPFSHVFVVLFSSENEKEMITQLYHLSEWMNYYNNKKKQFEILGPSPATISKIKNKHRWRLIVKGLDEEKLKNFVFYCIQKLSQQHSLQSIVMNLTLDPAVIL